MLFFNAVSNARKMLIADSLKRRRRLRILLYIRVGQILVSMLNDWFRQNRKSVLRLNYAFADVIVIIQNKAFVFSFHTRGIEQYLE